MILGGAEPTPQKTGAYDDYSLGVIIISSEESD